MASSDLNFETTVASYGATKSSSIFDAHVVFIPFVQILSLIEIGIPKHEPIFSFAFIFLSICFACTIAFSLIDINA